MTPPLCRRSVAALGAALGSFVLVIGDIDASAAVGGDVVGVHRLTLSSGPNFLSVPFQGAAVYRGQVESVSASGLAVAASPGWTAGQFAPRDGFAQYQVILRIDASGSPGAEGDWWTVQDNTASSLSVENRGEDLTTLLEPGDEVEVRRLTSFKDVFGSGPALRLLPDSDFDVLNSQEDFIRFVVGTAFAGEVFYHDGTLGPAGYYLDGDLVGSGDGSTLTLLPGQPIVFFRKVGAAPLELLAAGSVLRTPFQHYLTPGANAVGVVFPVPAPLGASGLLEANWISDVNFDVLTAEEDLIRAVYGTSFGEEIFHYAGPDADPGWYVNGEPDDAYQFQPTQAYMFFIKGAAPLRWRQSLPFDP